MFVMYLPSQVSISIFTRCIMENWFSDTKIEQTNSNTSSKQHGEVCHITELWFIVGLTQFQLGVL